MFDLILDQNFLSAMAAMIGPLAFFAAPTEEIEHLLFAGSDLESVGELGDLDGVSLPIGLAEAA